MSNTTIQLKKRSGLPASFTGQQNGLGWVRFGVMALLLAACGAGPVSAPAPTPRPVVTAAPSAAPSITTATAVAPAQTPIAATVRAITPAGTASSPTPIISVTPGKAVARITSPASGAVLAGEWTDVYGEVSCARSEIEYWKFEFEDGGFIARFMPGMFARNMLMHWKTASIAALIGNNQTRNVRVVVVCKDGSVLVSPNVSYTFK